MTQLSNIRLLGTLAVASPLGVELREGAQFTAMQTQIDALSSLHATAPVDWNQIIECGQDLLAHQGKDLSAACWLCLALYESDGIAGLADGIHIVAGLVQNFWESMLPPPKRLRARRNQVQWLLDRLTERLEQSAEDYSLPTEQRITLLDDLIRLQDAWQAHDDEAPAFYALKALLDRLVHDIAPTPEPVAASLDPVDSVTSAGNPPEAAPLPPVAPTTASMPVEPALPPSVQPMDLTQATQAQTVFEAALNQLQPAISWLLQHSPTSWHLFTLNRLCAWTALSETPPAQDRTTLLPPPAGMVLDHYAVVGAQNDPLILIEFAETRLGTNPYWLDLNRLSYQALIQLDATQAAQAVWLQLRGLLAHMPLLPDLCFNDGMPFADQATKDWLKDMEPSVAAQAPAQSLSGSSIEQAAFNLQELIEQSLPDSERVLLRLQLCQLALSYVTQFKQNALAST